MRKTVMLGPALALTLGVLAVPAQAVTSANVAASSGTVQGKAEVWHFWKSYWTVQECAAAADRVLASNRRYHRARCDFGVGDDHKEKYFLYIYY